MSDFRTGEPREPAPIAPGSGFSATEAAFEGFRILRRDPMSVVAWSLLSLGFTVLVAVVMVSMGGSALMQMTARTGVAPSPADATRALALMSQLAPAYLLIFLLSVLLYGVMYAAVNRAVLRPGKSFGHFGLGIDELLQVAALVLIWVILAAVYILGFIVVAVLAAVGAAVSKVLTVVAFVVGVPLVIAAVFFFMVRLSLVSPMTLERRTLVIGEAWRLTRGKAWPLFGAYLMAFVVNVIILIVVFSVVGGVAMAVAGPAGMVGIMRPDMTSLASYFGLVQIVNLLVSSAAYGLFFAILLGAPASAYAQLSRERRVADVFGSAVPPENRSTAFGKAP